MELSNITGFLKVLTWKKILQATVVLAIIGVAYGFWENRIIIYNSLRVGARVEVEQPLVLNLSPGTTKYLDESANKTKPIIAGIEVVNVDFKKNTKNTSYFAITDNDLRRSYDAFVSMKLADTPLFTNSEENNQKIIDLINGDFACYDYKSTTGYRAQNVTIICAISIPPYYGRFSGYMNIYIIKKPGQDDLGVIRQLARDMSFHIYEFDVNRTGRFINDQK